MLAGMEAKQMDTSYRQGIHRWEPWVVVLTAFIAGIVTMGAVVALLAYLYSYLYR